MNPLKTSFTTANKTVASNLLATGNGLEQERVVALVRDPEVGHHGCQHIGLDLGKDGDRVAGLGRHKVLDLFQRGLDRDLRDI